MNEIIVTCPAEFDFNRCLEFLLRSPKEILHYVAEEKVYKAIQVNDRVIVIELKAHGNAMKINFLNTKCTTEEKLEIERFVRQWFDLDTDLKPFYELARKDKLLAPLVETYFGYRIIGQPDLFESLIWAVLGQQINLQFAYTLKQRFVEQFGTHVPFESRIYYLFPRPAVVAGLTDADLLPLQFSKQKSKYVALIAQAFLEGFIVQKDLAQLPFDEAKAKLMRIKGVGNWTANYALMKTFRYPNAFPLEDAGVHNAIKRLKKMKQKPTLDQVKKIFSKYKGWEAYATLYLWKSL